MGTIFWELLAWVTDPKGIKPAKEGLVMLCVEETPIKWALFAPNPDGEWMIKSGGGESGAYAIKRPK
jgi:hypothetical protein